MENKSPLTTLCYIEKDGKYLMLHRVRKDKDVNKGKWIGVGGHFEEGESPEECLLREVREETGLTLTHWEFRGIVTFASEGWPQEYICVYTAPYPGTDEGAGKTAGMEEPAEVPFCAEGELAWVPKDELLDLNLWEGDRIFLKLLLEGAPFFSLKLCYRGDTLSYAALDGRGLELGNCSEMP
ncbi:MAG: 8-oxo-dGTP diphosphatase [Lachnospiraceae bacterium]|nr:8-oxo-dGTP diphosphatase [Lachnospiraceae bacterium]